MENTSNRLLSPLVVGIVAFIVGVLFGWMILGWYVWPVQWTDAGPQDLYQQARAEYVRMAIEAYGTNKDAILAKARFDALEKTAAQALADVKENPGTLPPDLIASFETAVGVVPGVVPPIGATPQPTKPAAGGGGIASWQIILLALCCLVLLAGGGAVAFYLFRSKSTGAVTPAMQAQQAARQAAYTDYAASGAEPPICQFMASYKLGDDLFDDSFSIDNASGEFLGECGVGISETIGVGDPKKVTAFEVWVFDKNDIQTVTKVLMSRHAFNDSSIRQSLAAKGEAVLIERGSEAVLETQTLQMVARVVDVQYGDGPVPPESFFDSLILELAIWPKPEI